jgi:hypothetical protein
MSILSQDYFKHTLIIIVISMVVVLNVSLLILPIPAQNMIYNQPGNQTTGTDLLSPRVVEEETRAEILGGQQ